MTSGENMSRFRKKVAEMVVVFGSGIVWPRVDRTHDVDLAGHSAPSKAN